MDTFSPEQTELWRLYGEMFAAHLVIVDALVAGRAAEAVAVNKQCSGILKRIREIHCA